MYSRKYFFTLKSFLIYDALTCYISSEFSTNVAITKFTSSLYSMSEYLNFVVKCVLRCLSLNCCIYKQKINLCEYLVFYSVTGRIRRLSFIPFFIFYNECILLNGINTIILLLKNITVFNITVWLLLLSTANLYIGFYCFMFLSSL